MRKGQVDKKDWTLSEKMQLLLKWARLVCAHYAIEVKNIINIFFDILLELAIQKTCVEIVIKIIDVDKLSQLLRNTFFIVFEPEQAI